MRGLNEFIKAVRNAKVRERAVAGIANALPHTLGRGALPGCADRRRRARAFQRVRGLGTPRESSRRARAHGRRGLPSLPRATPPPSGFPARSLARERAHSSSLRSAVGDDHPNPTAPSRAPEIPARRPARGPAQFCSGRGCWWMSVALSRSSDRWAPFTRVAPCSHRLTPPGRSRAEQGGGARPC